MPQTRLSSVMSVITWVGQVVLEREYVRYGSRHKQMWESQAIVREGARSCIITRDHWRSMRAFLLMQQKYRTMLS